MSDDRTFRQKLTEGFAFPPLEPDMTGDVKSMNMRLNLEGLLTGAILSIHPKSRGFYEVPLMELLDHLRQVVDDPKLLPEFAKLYCLTPRRSKKKE
jgi:hypothetical protein